MAENAVLFLAYNQIQQSIRSASGLKEKDSLSLQQLCVAGGLSGAIVSFVITPVELLKCRLQTQGYVNNAKHKGPWSVFFHTLKTTGVAGLYQGHTGTLLREISGGVAWFGVYEYTVKHMIHSTAQAKTKDDLSSLQLMCAGALAGMSYNAAFYPADAVKSRIQSGLHGNDGFITVARNMYRTKGFRVFFRGFGITVARSAPSSGVIFLTYVTMINCRNGCHEDLALSNLLFIYH
jgi:mitochondrial ornithine carrier protein